VGLAVGGAQGDLGAGYRRSVAEICDPDQQAGLVHLGGHAQAGDLHQHMALQGLIRRTAASTLGAHFQASQVGLCRGGEIDGALDLPVVFVRRGHAPGIGRSRGVTAEAGASPERGQEMVGAGESAQLGIDIVDVGGAHRHPGVAALEGERGLRELKRGREVVASKPNLGALAQPIAQLVAEVLGDPQPIRDPGLEARVDVGLGAPDPRHPQLFGRRLDAQRIAKCALRDRVVEAQVKGAVERHARARCRAGPVHHGAQKAELGAGLERESRDLRDALGLEDARVLQVDRLAVGRELGDPDGKDQTLVQLAGVDLLEGPRPLDAHSQRLVAVRGADVRSSRFGIDRLVVEQVDRPFADQPVASVERGDQARPSLHDWPSGDFARCLEVGDAELVGPRLLQ